MKTENIIFDLDGTLWDSSENVAASWNEIIQCCGHPLVKKLVLSGSDIMNVMGMTMDAIAEKLFPFLPEPARMELLEKCGENENNFLAVHGGKIFDGVESTLKKLSENHRLFIVSNCQCGYIEAFFEFSGLEKYFTDYLCWGDTGKPKSETIRCLMIKNHCSEAVYTGDTQGDCNAAADAGIPFVHAAYGFGEISTPERISACAKSFAELADIFE